MKSCYKFVIVMLAFLWAVAAYATCDSIGSNDFFTDKDHPLASDSNNGSENAPFVTIQKLVDTLQAGDCGFVRQSNAPYFEDVRKSGAASAGITIDNCRS